MPPLRVRDVVSALHAVGVEAGGTLMVHSSMWAIGRLDAGAATVLEGLLQCLGSQGTLVVPIFGALGALTDFVRDDPRAVCSAASPARVAAIGRHACDICDESRVRHLAAQTGHGTGTPYTKLAELGGSVLLLGVDLDRCTLLHTVEALTELAYLSPIEFTDAAGAQRTWKRFPGMIPPPTTRGSVYAMYVVHVCKYLCV
jgi:aminoglycoside 3-N-acetyltransferase